LQPSEHRGNLSIFFRTKVSDDVRLHLPSFTLLAAVIN
jgi:hypothetical protein